jgi:peptide deformylase
MTLQIAQLGQPVLRRKAHEVSVEEFHTPGFQLLVEQMLETVRESHGIGLAGPQVFSHLRLFLAAVLPPETEDGPPGFEVFINPKLHFGADKLLYGWEGCLSFQELLVLVPRHESVHIEYLDRHCTPRVLELRDFAARVVQHEFDHLEGILTLDRTPSPQYIIKASELEIAQKELEERSKERDRKEAEQ